KTFPNEAFRFLEVYYAEGKHTKRLLGTLLEDWKDFLEAAAECENPVPHIKQILNVASDETLTALRHPCAFTQLIEGSAPNIFDLPKLAERLPSLAESGLLIGDISFPNLSVEERSAAIERVAEHAIWKLTPKNVDTILAWHGVEDKAAHSKMFLSLKNAPSPVFDHVEGRINDFVDNCFLKADWTVSEPQEGVENLLSTQDLEENLGERVIKRQQTRVMFLHVPTRYWPTIIAERKFIIGWQNFEELFAETDDSAHLVPIFRSPDVVFELAEDRKEIRPELFDFLVDFDEMDLESYKILIGPDLGKVAELPTAIENDKRLHLIRLGMIELNQEAYDWLEGNPTLRVALIEKEFSTFQENEQDWTLQEEEVAGLLKSTIPQDAKRNLLLDIGTIECGDDETLQKEVVQILASLETVIGEFNQDFVERVIKVVPKCDAAKLLARMIPMWNEVRVMSNLETIGTPYKEIAEYGKKPLIPESDINLALANTLHQTGYISSFKKEKKGIRIYTKGKNPSEAAS
uniref:hypothetical protein n=1 Tax=Rhodopirellula sallentina TaxID=1263869 RepID=UPI0005C7DC00